MTTWLITGCSTGLGRALAEAVLAHGHNAVVTARDVTKVQDIADGYPDTALALTARRHRRRHTSPTPYAPPRTDSAPSTSS